MKYFLFICIASFSSLALAQDPQLEEQRCEDLLDSCEFYACLEAEYSCGKKGYPISFGQKFCLKYEKKLFKFTTIGKNWINKTKKCLIRKLSVYSEDLSCKELKKQAFKDHVPCYDESGYCELAKKDLKAVKKVIGLTMLKPRVAKSGLELKAVCHQKRLRSLGWINPSEIPEQLFLIPVQPPEDDQLQ